MNIYLGYFVLNNVRGPARLIYANSRVEAEEKLYHHLTTQRPELIKDMSFYVAIDEPLK